MEELKPCPWCKRIPKIGVFDDEGNQHDDGYENDPWSGLTYGILHMHEESIECPIAQDDDDGGHIGIWLYDTEESASDAWNTRSEPEARALTLDELRLMDGKPVWIDGIKQWAIVVVDTMGYYANIPFVLGKIFKWNVKERNLKCYDHEPTGE